MSSDESGGAPEGLAALRAALDGVDRSILEGLAARRDLVARVGELKAGGGKVVRDTERESALLGKLVAVGEDLGLDPWLVTRVFHEILEHSLRTQHARLHGDGDGRRVVGFQGAEGAFSHAAARRHYAGREGDLELRGYEGFRPMLEAVRDGVLDEAVLPIENTTAGSINESYDLLAELDLHVVGEVIQPVVHCLIGLAEDVALGHLECIVSHPVALAQCRTFLSGLPGCRVEAFRDTAEAVSKIASEGDPRQAAIASEEAARLRGLPVLRRGIQDQRENYTRMMIVARQARLPDARVPAKVSMVFATRHERGALARAIAILAAAELNLTKLESRPRPGSPWEYRFYLDFQGHLGMPEVTAALAAFATETSFLRVLGCYPAQTLQEAQPARPRRVALPVPDPTLTPKVRVGPIVVGDAEPDLFAGPAVVESAAEVREAAEQAAALGADGLWGAFLEVHRRVEGRLLVDLLHEAASARGLVLALPVSHAGDVQAFAPRADLLVIDGARMEDASLLRAASRADAAIALGRAPSADVAAWLAAAGQVRAGGNGRVILLDQGVRAPGSDARRLDLAGIPEASASAPVLVDLSVASDAARIRSAAEAAGAAGAVLRLEGAHGG